jgi:hypothetical protein
MAMWEKYMEKRGWRTALTSGKVGTGDWSAFDISMEDVEIATSRWKEELGEVELPWLCWNINLDWCVLQQKLVLAVGWTPVVGWDPNCPNAGAGLIDGAIAIDFNETLKLPVMWAHFPIEFAFMWSPRLAFWHSDLLVRMDTLKKISATFEALKDGELSAVRSYGGRSGLLRYRKHRYWELIGCTTRGASRHQFDHGCGWWRNFHLHPNTPQDQVEERAKYYCEHGVGVMYWKRKYKRTVVAISEKEVAEGHCTRIGNADYVTDDDKGKELSLNFDLGDKLRDLGLEGL